MDPFGDLFSFINNNDLKEGEGVQNDIEKKKGGQKPRRKLLKIICQLCEEGEVHEQCQQKRTSKAWKTDGEYACDKCKYTGDKPQHLRYHIEGIHSKIKNFRCSLCSHETYNKLTLQLHVKRQHKNKPSRIIKIGCPLCETNQSHEYCEKKREAEGMKGRKYLCDKCEYTFDKKQFLQLHVEAVHLKIKNFRCSLCSFETYKKRELQLHVNLQHKNKTFRIIKIGCLPCETNQSHKYCEKKKEAGRIKDRQYSCDKKWL